MYIYKGYAQNVFYMPHSISYFEEDNYLTASYKGIVDAGEIKTAVKEISEAARIYNCYNWLIDFTDCSNLRFSVVEMVRFSESFYTLNDNLGSKKFLIKRAIIFSEKQTDFNFIEVLSSNRGQDVKVFRNQEEAVQWLQSES